MGETIDVKSVLPRRNFLNSLGMVDIKKSVICHVSFLSLFFPLCTNRKLFALVSQVSLIQVHAVIATQTRVNDKCIDVQSVTRKSFYHLTVELRFQSSCKTTIKIMFHILLIALFLNTNYVSAVDQVRISTARKK